MPGFTRRSKPLKGTVQLTDISNFAITNASESDLIVFDSGTGNWVNRKSLTGDYSISGSLTVNSIVLSAGISLGTGITAAGDLDIGGNADIDGTLVVGGITTLAAVNATGNATIGGTLGVTGTLTGSAFSFSGAGTVGGNLTVTGTLSAGTYSVTDLSPSGNVEIAGYLTVGSFLNVTGNITAGNINGAAVGGTTLSSAGTITGAGDLDISGIGWSNTAGDVTAQLTTYDGTYTIKGRESVGLTDVTMAVLDPAGEWTLYRQGGANLASRADGQIEVTGIAASDNPAIWFVDSTNTDLSVFYHIESSNTGVWSGRKAGALMDIRSRNAGDTAYHQILEGNPDGALTLFENNEDVAKTINTGMAFCPATGGLSAQNTFWDPGFSTEWGRLVFNSNVSTSYWRAEQNSWQMQIRSKTSAGATAVILSGDPDSDTKLYYQGVLKAATTGDGIATYSVDTSTTNSVLRLRDSAGSTKTQIYHSMSSTDFLLQNITNGGRLRFYGKTTAGTTTQMVVMDPDDSVLIDYTGGGLVCGSPTGGNKGTGTINATAVYDDNTLLTDYVFDAELDGTLDIQKWDNLAPNTKRLVRDATVDPETGNPIPPVQEDVVTQHEPARRFATRLDDLDPKAYGNKWKARRRLPAFDSPSGQPEQLPIGAWSQRLLETCEVQAVHIDKLLARIEILEAAVGI